MRFIHVVLVLFLLPATASAAEFRSKACACSFAVPNGWEVVVNPATGVAKPVKARMREECSFGLRPKNWEKIRQKSDTELGEFALHLYVFDDTLAAAAREAFFATVGEIRKEPASPALVGLREDAWLLVGCQGSTTEPSEIGHHGWKGIMGEAEVGHVLKDGEGNAGLGPDFRAAISDRRRAAAFVADSREGNDAFERVVFSFRFLKGSK